MKVFNLVFVLLFIVFAALQYNDPDPYIWIPIYLYAAFLCWRAYKGHFDRTLYLTGFAALGLYALLLFFDKTGVVSWLKDHNAESITQSMKASQPWIEETREFFGLLIVLVVMLINWMHFKRTSSANA